MKKFLTQSQINYIKEASAQGKSLNYISSRMNISKTTAYWWYRKSVGIKIKPIKIDTSELGLLGQIAGAFCGDGNFYFRKDTYHYKITFYLGENEFEYALFLSETLNKVFSRKPFIWHNKKGHVYYVVIHGKDIYKFLRENLLWEDDKTLSICLAKPLVSYDKRFLKGFVRGFFDTDGFVTKKGIVCIGVISNSAIKQTSDILSLLNIEHSCTVRKEKPPRRALYELHIKKRHNKKFMKLIGSSNPHKISQLKASVV